MTPERQTSILLVDDTTINLDILVNALEDDYDTIAVTNGPEALDVMASRTVDLVLLDIMMPGMDGHQVLERMTGDPGLNEIPVIFLTALTDTDSKSLAFQGGAVDYITKPFDISEVRARVHTHVALKQARERLQDQNRHLESEVARRTEDIIRTRDDALRMAAALAESRDVETGNHIIRTQKIVRLLLDQLNDTWLQREGVDDQFRELMYLCAPLHDIGKIGIPDRILLKPGRLTEEEFDIMKTHTTIGWEALRKSGTGSSPFLSVAAEIALSHHEKWDGTGYPKGLRGQEIPLSGRIMALSDVYDALLSRNRPYKDGYDHEKALEIIREGRGSHFDPDLHDVFISQEKELLEIETRYHDD